MRQKITNVILFIVLIILSIFLGFLFYEVGSLRDANNQIVGTMVAVIFGLSFLILVAIGAAVCGVISILNMKDATLENKLVSGFLSLGYLCIFVLAIFKTIYF